MNSLSDRIIALKNISNKDNILIHEIYDSLQGESTYAGLPCIFIRTTACHLRCSYCDTKHAFYKGKEYNVDTLIDKVNSYNIPLVEITGGEPLLQNNVYTLLSRLCSLNYTVLLETSGAVSIKNVDRRVKIILDVKTPGSKEVNRNVWSNLEILWQGCEVKFVICNQEDYQFAKNIINEFDLINKCVVLFSPEAKTMNKAELAFWIIKDKLNVRMQVQLHKVIWGNKSGV
jgi:7-carboxy-7-deazaguanine synthase